MGAEAAVPRVVNCTEDFQSMVEGQVTPVGLFSSVFIFLVAGCGDVGYWASCRHSLAALGHESGQSVSRATIAITFAICGLPKDQTINLRPVSQIRTKQFPASPSPGRPSYKPWEVARHGCFVFFYHSSDIAFG